MKRPQRVLTTPAAGGDNELVGLDNRAHRGVRTANLQE